MTTKTKTKFEQGDIISYEHKNKKFKGKIVSVDEEEGTVLVHGFNQPKAVTVDADECKLISKADDDDDDDD